MSTKFVRMKPYDPKRGHVRDNFKVTSWPKGPRFKADGTIYGINAECADYLGTLKQVPDHGELSPALFDVWETREDARKAVEAERRGAMGKIEDFRQEPASSKPPPLTFVQIDHSLSMPEPIHEVELPETKPAPESDGAAEVIDAESVSLKAGSEFDGFMPDEAALADAAATGETPQAPPAPKKPSRRRRTKRE